VFLLRTPSNDQVQDFLKGCKADTFSYSEVGATRESPPQGYTIDHNRIKLGAGRLTYERATAAIRAWAMFDIGWVKLWPRKVPVAAGEVVAVLVRHLGFYSLNAARIVYTIDEEGVVSRFGFAYGTLTQHGEIGEERFSVEHDTSTDEVSYDLFAFSRPGLIAMLGYPFSRGLQKRFARNSLKAMLREVSG